MKRLPSRVLLALIGAYQRWVSPAFGPRCRYYPTCSAYAAQAIRELGPLRGTILAGWRLIRCNPLSHGGVDRLEDRKVFRRGRIETHSTPSPALSAATDPPVASERQ